MAKNVLIVDDNEHLRQILASVLRNFGYEVSEAATGDQAIASAISLNPHLILMDLDLPDMSGAEVARAIRNYSAMSDVPIIGCSAYIGWEFREEALRAGMVDYLEKPISPSIIQARIQQFILAER